MDRELKKVLEERQRLERMLREEPFLTLKLTPRQVDFTNSLFRETALFGLNQGGKTVALLAKARYHLTGLYPKGYKGHRFKKPIVAAMAGVTVKTTRDVLVDRLLGNPRERGHGFLPKGSFDPKTDVVSSGSNVKDDVDYILVDWHDENGVVQGKSQCYFFTYKSGADRVMGYPLDWVGIDEEPPFDVYDELSARLNGTRGYMDISMTPMKGETQLYLHFRDSESPLRQAMFYDITKASWMTDDHRAELIEKYRFHPYAAARLRGEAVAGVGLMYPAPDELIGVDPFPIPDYYTQIIGLDLPHTTGYFAAVKLAIDPNTDTMYLVDSYKERDAIWSVHAQAVSRMGGKKIPVAWPNDGRMKGVDVGGKASATIISQYKNFGLNVLRDPAHSVDQQGNKNPAVGPIVDEICERMATGRFRVFWNQSAWFEEKRRYRHDGTKIVESKFFEPDLLDATAKAVMMSRYAKAEKGDPKARFVIDDLGSFSGDFDFFGGTYTNGRM